MDEVLSDSAQDGAANARLLAAAIVIAGALIGLGAYFGLRRGEDEARVGQPPASASSAAPTTATAPLTPTAPQGSSTTDAQQPVPDQRAVLQRRVADEVRNHLEALRPTLAERCWKPSAAQAADPPSATFQVRLAFRANGELAHYGVADATDPARADVVECLRAQQLDIAVKPPGQLVGTQQTLTLP